MYVFHNMTELMCHQQPSSAQSNWIKGQNPSKCCTASYEKHWQLPKNFPDTLAWWLDGRLMFQHWMNIRLHCAALVYFRDTWGPDPRPSGSLVTSFVLMISSSGWHMDTVPPPPECLIACGWWLNTRHKRGRRNVNQAADDLKSTLHAHNVSRVAFKRHS